MNNKDNPVPSLENLKQSLLADAEIGPISRAYLAKLLDKEILFIQNGVETDKEQPKYEANYININATDDPLEIINLDTNISKEYGVEGLPWKLVGRKTKDQEIL